MNYKRIHDFLIDRARNRIYDSSIYQNHHIIPRHELESSTECVPLTPKEHRIVHYLRYKNGCGVGNYKAYLMMRGLPELETLIKIVTAAGKIGGASTRNNNTGIFSPEWDRSAETKRRHTLGILTPYLKGDPELARYVGMCSYLSGKGIYNPEYDRSSATVNQWKSGKMDHLIEMLQENASIGGKAAWETKSGWFAISKDEHLKNCSKGGKISGVLPHWTNGHVNKKSIDRPGDDFYRGRTPYWNNGIIQTVSKCAPGVDWVKGKIKVK